MSALARLILLLLLLPVAAQAQITFRAGATAFNEGMGVQHSAVGALASGNGATVTPGLPARVAGDLLLAIVEAGDLNAITMPSPNWTVLATDTLGTVHQAKIFWRIATDTAADTATISHAGPGGRNVLIARVVAFSNVDPANPFDGFVFGNTGGTAGDVDTGAINTANACSVLVATVHISDDNSLQGTPPGWNQSFFNSTSTGNDAAIGLWYQRATAAGAQPSQNINYTGNDRASAAQFGLRPGGIVINVPAGTQAGDVMVANVAIRPANTNAASQNAVTICPPAGWTLVRDTINNNGGGTGGAGSRLLTYYRVATGGEPASYRWFAQLNDPSVPPATVFVSGVGSIASYSGVDNANPIDVEGGNLTGASYSHTANGITTTVANTMLVASHTFASADSWTPPAGMTERADVSAPAAANSVGISMEVSEQATPAAGPTGNRTAVAGGASNPDNGIAHMIALRPPPAPAGPGGFNAFEPSTAANAITGVITTKVAGALGSVDIVALDLTRTAVQTSFTGTVRVEVLDASDNGGALDPATGCRASWVSIHTVPVDPVFVLGNNGRITVAFTVANVYRDARVRVTWPVGAPTVAGCSTDNFAIRPASLAVGAADTDWQTAGGARTLNNTGAAGGVVHKAGCSFRLQVTPAPGTATNYDGSPTVSALACSLPAPCANGVLTLGVFGGTGTRVSDTASYSEAGAFSLTMVDQTYASVDAADTVADCSATGRYVCQSPAPSSIGRFVPDRFALTAVAQPVFRTFDTTDASCSVPPAGPRRSFTYVGQPFGYATAPAATIVAQNAAGATTTNYRGALWKLAAAGVTQSFANAPVLALDASQITAPALAETPDTGTGTLTGNAGDKLAFVRNAAVASAPFSASLALTWDIADASEAGAGQGTIGTAAALVFDGGGTGIGFDSGAEFRYGRLRLTNANGSQLVALPVPMEAQYFAGAAGFVTNVADHCTSLAANNVALGGFSGNLVACETAVSGAGTLTSGRRTLILAAPGGANDGGVIVTANLGTAASGTTCLAVGGGTVPAAGASQLWLQGNWTGAAYDDNPTARATFGAFKGAGEVIYMRENF